MRQHVGFTSVLRRYLVGTAVVALAGCTAPPATIEGGASFRDQAVPMGVTSRFDAERFEGPWRVRAFLPESEEISAINLEARATGLQLQVAAFVCDPAGVCGTFGDTLKVTQEGTGKYLIQMPDGALRLMWVIWVDEGFRTAVVGNPEGTYAWILDRQAKGGADRIRAAREILEFNGYDISKLKGKS